MTNPNNAVGTNAAYDGRTSVNAFNDDLAAFSSGIISGWACSPDSGMTVSLGGDGNTRDVAVAEDNAGNKTSINNISGSPVNVTLNAAPGANSRIDLVVAYVDNPPTGVSTVADNPSACGIINVTGTPSSTPVVPNDSTIRTAITGDGASGTTAYYVILAQILVTSGTTDITSADITAGASAVLNANQIADSSIGVSKLDFTTLQPVNLYTGPSSASGPVNLLDSVANYEFLQIQYYRSGSLGTRTGIIIKANSTSATLHTMNAANTVMSMYSVVISISTNSISFGIGRAIAFNSNGSLAGWGSSNEIVIESITGFKKTN